MPEAPSLTLDRLYASPGLSGPSPRAVKYSPDGARVTFLKGRDEDGSRLDLWQFDVATGAQSMLVDSTLLEPEEVELSEEETALRERQRIAGQRGIVSYDWGTADTVLVPIGGDLWLVTLVDDGPEIRQLTDTDAFEYDAKVSPSGRYVSFIRDGAVWAIDLESGDEQRLTPEAEPENAISYGVAEFVAQEEMSRYTGYWWSPDDRYLAYTRVDESTVDIIPRYDIAAGETTVVEQRYPRAGRPNAIVDLFVRDMETGEVTEVSWRRDDWGPATDQYLTKVAWSQIANLHIQVSNRFQSEIRELTALGLRNWSALERPLKTQSSQTWVNLQPFGERGNRSHVWVTEETGFAALRGLFDEQPFVDRVGSENWSIDELLVWEALVPVEGSGVSGRTFIGIAHFTGFKDTPLERHLYRTDFRTGDISRITPLGSSWSITMAPDGKSFVGTSSSPDQPPQTGLYRADGTLIAGDVAGSIHQVGAQLEGAPSCNGWVYWY
ncbi:MAG: DPP IV N-terminal domain-containing protein, partial [Pseudomonadota bacterium]